MNNQQTNNNTLCETNRKILRELPQEILQEVKDELKYHPGRENDFLWILNACLRKLENVNNYQVTDFLKRHGFDNCARKVARKQQQKVFQPREPFEYKPTDRLTQKEAKEELYKLDQTLERDIKAFGNTIATEMHRRLRETIKLRIEE